MGAEQLDARDDFWAPKSQKFFGSGDAREAQQICLSTDHENLN